MNRILIIGNAGAGKTTFSKSLALKTGLPLFSLDSIVWKPGWVKTPETDKREKIQGLIANEKWIIDGVSRQVFSAADTIYFIDTPLPRCIFNILKRFLANGLRTRESLPAGCPEYIGVFKALKVAFAYKTNTRPWIVDLISANPDKKIVWVKSPQSIQLSAI